MVEPNDTAVTYDEPEPAGPAHLPDVTIDRGTPVPFYFQLAELLEEEIVSGRWPPGARIPSEGQLGERYELSRTTIRQALARLEQEGLIDRVKGRGTFVRDSRPRSWMIQSTEGFFGDELRRAGRSVASRILRLERARLPRWASDALGVGPGEQGLIIERIRSVDGLVALHVANYLPGFAADAAADLAPDESLYERLAEHGISITGGRRSVEAIEAGPELAKLLEVRRGDSLACIESVTWDEEQRPVECYRAWLRTDRVRLEIEVTAQPGVDGAIPHIAGLLLR